MRLLTAGSLVRVQLGELEKPTENSVGFIFFVQMLDKGNKIYYNISERLLTYDEGV